MSFPPPPGLGSSSASGHPSLPARPPPSIGVQSHSSVKAPAANGSANGFKPAFTAFAPRQVASVQRTHSPASSYAASTPVTSSYGPGVQYPTSQVQPQTYATTQYSVPEIKNPFMPTPQAGGGTSSYADYDNDYEAQVAQWQSAYVPREGEKTSRQSGGATVSAPPSTARTTATAATTTTTTESPGGSNNNSNNKPVVSQTVQRSGGGQTWHDPSLLEWDPAHFRIFVGNLAGEVTDDSLLKAFSKYPTVQKAKVIRDKRTTKSKGFGFVSFKDGDDYFQAAREMQGKYIGSHPVLIKKSTTEIKPISVHDKNNNSNSNRNNKNNSNNSNTKNKNKKTSHDGVTKKKNDKTKGGLRVLG